MFKAIILLVLLPFAAFGSEEVEIYGSAENAKGGRKTASFSFEEQNPPLQIISERKSRPKEKKLPQKLNAEVLRKIHQISAQNPKPFSISPEAEQNQIENTLYEGGNRIYDVQSFPLKDIKTITTPNIDPTISTYPEY